MIKAKTKYTLPIMMEYNKILVKKRLPMLIITAAIFVLGVAASIIGLVVSHDNKSTFAVFGITFWIFGGGILLMNTAMPKSVCKKMAAKDISIEYEFDDEEIRTIYTQSGASSNYADKLSSIKSVSETSDCFFVTINTTTVFIVDKSQIEGTETMLRDYFIEKLPKNVCKLKEKTK